MRNLKMDLVKLVQFFCDAGLAAFKAGVPV